MNNLRISQLTPAVYIGQLQQKLPFVFVQFPPFWQGFSRHSFISRNNKGKHVAVFLLQLQSLMPLGNRRHQTVRERRVTCSYVRTCLPEIMLTFRRFQVNTKKDRDCLPTQSFSFIKEIEINSVAVRYIKKENLKGNCRYFYFLGNVCRAIDN